MVKTNDVLIGVALLERVVPLLKVNTRETISKNNLNSIGQQLNSVLTKIIPYCKDPVILTPIVEVIELVKVISEDINFIETSAETKDLIVERIESALGSLYLFAGRFYMENEFNESSGLNRLLINIIEGCMAQGFYFGYDNRLRAEGLL